MKRMDLTGKRFGQLTVISYAGFQNRRAMWRCLCDCGCEMIVRSEHLTSGRTKSCGHCHKYEDLTGQKFGRLTAIEYAGRRGIHTLWRCKCECGGKTLVRADCLKAGRTLSCGCLAKEQLFNNGKKSSIHGQYNTRIYNIWKLMKQRCFNPKAHGYKYYGGRGISMCGEWKGDFQSFYDWSINNGYNDKLTIDRIDCDGDYEPVNCRWTDFETQWHNKKRRYQP